MIAAVSHRLPDTDVVDAIALPRVIRLRDNLFAVTFVLMKLLPARFILERAEAEGRIGPGSTIAETTSGTFGLALAMISNLRGYRLVLVSDPAIDPPLRRRLEDLGAEVRIVTEPAPIGGLQQARLDCLEATLAEYPGSFCPRQYSNPHNPGAYAPCAEIVAETLGQVDHLVGTVGSGGSMCGTSRFLRTLFADLRTIGVDTHGSVIFGQPDHAKRMLRGLGNSLMPPNVDHTAFDEVHWVSAAEGFTATRELHRRHSIFQGPTSGAAYLVADRRARERPDELVAVMLPDEGYRYQDTVYDDAWLRAHGLLLDRLPEAPVTVDRPEDASGVWSRYLWDRRTYESVVGHPFVAGASPPSRRSR